MLTARTETPTETQRQRIRFCRPVWSDRGSVLPVVVVILVTVSALSVAVSRTGRVLIDQARADATADVVALAGAAGGDVIADEVAAANGATLVGFARRTDGAVMIGISRQGRRSEAAAAVASEP